MLAVLGIGILGGSQNVQTQELGYTERTVEELKATVNELAREKNQLEERVVELISQVEDIEAHQFDESLEDQIKEKVNVEDFQAVVHGLEVEIDKKLGPEAEDKWAEKIVEKTAGIEDLIKDIAKDIEKAVEEKPGREEIEAMIEGKLIEMREEVKEGKKGTRSKIISRETVTRSTPKSPPFDKIEGMNIKGESGRVVGAPDITYSNVVFQTGVVTSAANGGRSPRLSISFDRDVYEEGREFVLAAYDKEDELLFEKELNRPYVGDGVASFGNISEMESFEIRVAE